MAKFQAFFLLKKKQGFCSNKNKSVMKIVINISEKPIKTLFSNRFCFNVVSKLSDVWCLGPSLGGLILMGGDYQKCIKGSTLRGDLGFNHPKSLIKSSKHLKALNDPQNPPMATKGL